MAVETVEYVTDMRQKMLESVTITIEAAENGVDTTAMIGSVVLRL